MSKAVLRTTLYNYSRFNIDNVIVYYLRNFIECTPALASPSPTSGDGARTRARTLSSGASEWKPSAAADDDTASKE